jgi:hypothetical protein
MTGYFNALLGRCTGKDCRADATQSGWSLLCNRHAQQLVVRVAQTPGLIDGETPISAPSVHQLRLVSVTEACGQPRASCKLSAVD